MQKRATADAEAECSGRVATERIRDDDLSGVRTPGCWQCTLTGQMASICHASDMGWKEFAASVIGDVLSWPVMVFIVVLLLLQPLKRLISRIKTARGMGVDVEFSDELQSLEQSADAVIDEIAEKSSRRAVPLERGGPPVEDEQPFSDKHQRSAGASESELDRETVDSAEMTLSRFEREEKLHNMLGGASVENLTDAQRKRISEFVRSDASLSTRAVFDPSGAIIAAWERLVAQLIELNVATRGRGRPTQNARLILDQLRRSEKVPASFVETVDSLQKLRNEVAHGEVSPSSGAARTYVRRARQMQNVAYQLVEAGKNNRSETTSE